MSIAASVSSNPDRFPPRPESVPETAFAELDRAVARLQERKSAFARLSLDDRIRLLEKLLVGVKSIAADWANAGASAKGLWPQSVEAGEEWVSGPVVTMRNIRLLREALIETRNHGTPRVPASALSCRADGRLVVQVFPHGMWDRLLFLGYTGEVWMEPLVTAENLRDHQAAAYRTPREVGEVSLVLGAGNQSAIPPMDALYKLFVENQVVLLKMNPVNDYVGPLYRKAFQCLVDEGWFEVVYGGAGVGAYLCQHEGIENVHITGSDKTHDAIVWGPPAEQASRKARGEPVLRKPITSELGNVTPIVVVPGPWNEKQIAFHAGNVASMVANNASFNCVAGKLLVTPTDWPQRQEFLDSVRRALARLPARKAYYPGARERWQRFIDAHPTAERLGEDLPETVPWTFISGLNPAAKDDICFRMEPFCGVLHEVSLPGKTAAEFLPAAVQFCNDTVWGTLAMSVLIHPDTRHDPALEAAFQDALDALRYGSICVNHWAGLVYGLVTPTWGAYPGHALEDIQSGRGIVHNTFLFDKPQKSVVYGPFVPSVKPPWLSGHRRLRTLGEALVDFEARPSVVGLLRVLPNALG